MRRVQILIALLMLSSCAAKDELPQTGVKSLTWLSGTWMSDSDSEDFLEEWREDGPVLRGQGRVIKGSDTSNMERLTILQDDKGLAYIVKLPEREVRFGLKSQTVKEEFGHLQDNQSYIVTFVNDTNDFPRQIVYDRPHDDSLYITLTGDEGSRSVSMTFKMKRIK